MNDLVSTIARANQIAKDAIEAEMEGDVTASQARYMMALASAEGSSQTVLTDMSHIDRSTLADVSRRLLKKGLISRKRTKADARTYAVTLTDAGWKKVHAIKAAVRRAEAKIRKEIRGVDGLEIVTTQVAAE